MKWKIDDVVFEGTPQEYNEISIIKKVEYDEVKEEKSHKKKRVFSSKKHLLEAKIIRIAKRIHKKHGYTWSYSLKKAYKKVYGRKK